MAATSFEGSSSFCPALGEDMAHLVQQAQETFALLQTPKAISDFALFYKSLGDETRLKIVALLLLRDLCLCELVDGLNVPTSTMNHHLQMLVKGGVIQGRREGKFTIYHLNEAVRPYLPFVEVK
ncbi:ArsR/SmtB family transcription factor [Sulfoacidibacillus thermotolerans]|uniref:HTH arsR-type domain-containing protein n=1 Tax=Sulfoacidibacillus thermotolerans TaxID=1765684 RepID=A0A2U3CU02_SULT2|nr:metalloregulator ArsR/SmtB family transcription factor [Sulfoacidibacillus thermotolerans]PWI52497.1 hypothetical protein BM613_14120 [Sulfoacidibacillus thermotolerans]